MNYEQIKACRICGNKKLSKIGSLGMIAVSDFTTTPQDGIKMPLELVYCKKCTLVQLNHNFDRDLLYKHYWYTSGLNKAIVADLKEIASFVKGDTHIDIAANDGTLLTSSPAKHKIAVDPCDIKPLDFEWYNIYWEDFSAPFKATTITAIACLYDLPDPNKFIANVKKHLTPDGLFISQFQPLEQMVELNDVGNICHEHLEYYSYKSLVYLFEMNGLEIFKVERNKMNGGSYRVFARHFTKGSIDFQEKEYGIKELKDFFTRIEENKEKMLQFLKTTKGIVSGYGASTKANTILQYYGITDQDILSIIDVNERKLAKYTINSKIFISSAVRPDPDYLWVFPYGFIDYFKEKEKGYKGKWVTTIPEFQIC